MQIFKAPNYNFVRWRWHAIVLSLVVILAGLGAIWSKGGLKLGVEFAGGTIVIVQFDQMPQIQQVRSALGAMPGGETAVVQQYGEAARREVMIRVAQVGAETGGELSKTADAVIDALRTGNLGNFTVVGTEIVGPVVGDQLKRQGTLATILALGGILVYIALRFQLSFAVGAVVATIHDLLVTLAFLTFFDYDMTLNVIAAILTITGYSVNDTIVVFDRVRENLRGMRRDNLEHIVNVAVNQTLARTVITAGTTLLSVLALFLFGGEVLRGFAFTMMVGIISGTYSTVFIAAAIAIMWQGKRPLKGQAAPATSPAERRSGRRARAS
ncbi:MAG TPA: protein translocase subunit SecF [Vicinamibacterales bacterium]|nr:protein translocase subunit SecF [Vicinamibacterales bacterium]